MCKDVLLNLWPPILQITGPLTLLAGLPRLRLVDLRAIHAEQEACWSETKCASMAHVMSLTKSLKRRQPPGVVRICSH